MRLFEAVSRLKSFTKAAGEVNLTQPTVSMQVKRLEEKVGMPLTESVGKQVHMTLAGEKVYDLCRDVLERVAGFETELDDLRGEVAGPLKVAVVSSAKYVLPHLLGEFRHLYPKVDPQLQIVNRAVLLERLQNNADDLYVMGKPPEDIAVTEFPFLENVIVAAARPDHPLARQNAIPLQRLADQKIIMREPGSGTRQAIERLCAAQGVDLHGSMELDDAEAIKQGVIADLGIAFLSLHSLRLELETKQLVTLDVVQLPLRRRWFAMHRDGKHLSNAARAFLTYLREEGEQEVAHLLVTGEG